MNLTSWIAESFGILDNLTRTFQARWPWRRYPSAPGNSSLRTPIALLIMLSLLIPRYAMGYTTGKVVDFYTKEPIAGAFVTSGNYVERTDANGMFFIKTEGNKVAVRAYGYLRTEQIITAPQGIKLMSLTSRPIFLSPCRLWNRALWAKADLRNEPILNAPQEIKIVPFTPKALYLSFYGIGSKTLRQPALKLIQETELNALVIDVKGDRGMIPYKSAIPLASEVGAQKIITVKDMSGLIKSLRENGLYTIARIVTFKDNLLALKRPDLAVKTQRGEIWRDRENLAWVDPFKKEVWDYNIDIAIEAAQIGFDEIQFDYIRFPDSRAPHFSMPSTEENRVNAICGFILEAKKRLIPYNVFLAGDIFGYVDWNLNDTEIGQKLEDLAPHLDYISPMLYPSGFQYGIPGYRIPVAFPYEIVYRSLKRAQERTQLPSIRFRPWLQAFRDYAFDRRHFGDKEIRVQIQAAEEFGSNGWMLWNPRNNYSAAGLKKRSPMGLDAFLLSNLGRL